MALITVEILEGTLHADVHVDDFPLFRFLDLGVLEIAQFPDSKKVECLIPNLGLFCM